MNPASILAKPLFPPFPPKPFVAPTSSTFTPAATAAAAAAAPWGDDAAASPSSSTPTVDRSAAAAISKLTGAKRKEPAAAAAGPPLGKVLVLNNTLSAFCPTLFAAKPDQLAADPASIKARKDFYDLVDGVPGWSLEWEGAVMDPNAAKNFANVLARHAAVRLEAAKYTDPAQWRLLLGYDLNPVFTVRGRHLFIPHGSV